MASRGLKIFFDGGCCPNPGPIEAAVVARGTTYLFEDLGFGTSNDAEWLALILALELAHSLDLSDIILVGDARDVIQEGNRILQTGHAKPGHASTFLDLAVKAPRSRIRWIRRTQNLAGIALAARHPRQRPCIVPAGEDEM